MPIVTEAKTTIGKARVRVTKVVLILLLETFETFLNALFNKPMVHTKTPAWFGGAKSPGDHYPPQQLCVAPSRPVQPSGVGSGGTILICCVEHLEFVPRNLGAQGQVGQSTELVVI